MIAGLSGAQAAAADLARMRASTTDEVEVDEAMLESARQLFAGCEAYFKASRTYPEGYPARERFLASLDEKIRAHVQRFDDIVVELTPKGAAMEGEPIYEVERADLNLWYPLYRDGVRQLTVGDGITRDELVQFFKALVELAAMKTDDEGDGEDDAVTMLWDLDLAHVSYVAIDTFVSGAGGDDAAERLDRIREIVTIGMMKDLAQANLTGSSLGKDVGIAKRMRSIALGRADLTFLQQENLGALSELPHHISKASDRLFDVTGDERAAFAAELNEDRALFDKFLEALVRALVTEGGSAEADALCSAIERFFTQIVVEESFVRAAALRAQAVGVLDPRTGARPELIERVERAMSADATVDAIAGALAKWPDDRLAQVYALVEVMPRRAAPRFVRALGDVSERVRRRTLCDIVAKWGTSALDAASALLPQAGEEVALDVLYLIRKVGSERAIALLDEATRHGSAQVRVAALQLYFEVAPRDAAIKRSRGALRDSDSLVRAVAVEAILRFAPDGAGAWLREAITADGFGKLDAVEKARLFLAYARLGGEAAAEDLLDRLNQRNLLMNARIDEERAAAARALAAIAYAPARAVIEKLAKAKLARSVLSDACADALAAFEAAELEVVRPAEPQPVASVPHPEVPVVSFKPKAPK